MSSSLVPWEPRRFSRALLRQWLEQSGSQPLEAVLLQARLQVSDMTEEELERELREHPRLFSLLADGMWMAAPEQRYLVVYPRPRPPVKSKKTQAKKREKKAPAERASKKSSPETRHTPPSLDPFHVQSGRLVSVVFRRDVEGEGAAYESGGQLLLPVPQDAEISDVVRDAITDACRNADEVQVYERATDAPLLFRGHRRLLQASVTPDGTRIHLVFAAADDDEGRRHALLKPGPALLAPGATRALTISKPASQIAADEGVSQSLQKLLALPPGRRKVDRVAAFKRAKELLLSARAKPLAWSDFRDWLIRKRPEYDRELIEMLLKLALDSGIEGVSVFHLARMVLEDRLPLSGTYAAAMCIALAGTRDASALDWAGDLLPRALEVTPDDPRLKLAAGRIQANRGDHKQACAMFAEAAGDPTISVDPEWVEEYLLAAEFSHEKRIATRALKTLDQLVSALDAPVKLAPFRHCLQLAIDLAETVEGSVQIDRIEQLLQLLVATDETAAIREWEVRSAGTTMKLTDKLRLLSVLEDCEDSRSVAFLHAALVSTAQQTLAQAKLDLIESAILAMGFVEEAVGDVDHEESGALQRELDARRERLGRQAIAASSSCSGKSIVLIGGRAATRQRAAHHLLQLGAASVREIPPSWEQHLDEDAVRAKVSNADIVATLTDCMKHDASAIIQNLRSAGMRFKSVRTAGGPSRIVRDIVADTGNR